MDQRTLDMREEDILKEVRKIGRNPKNRVGNGILYL